MYTEPFIRIITIKRRPKCKYCWNYVEFIAILFAFNNSDANTTTTTRDKKCEKKKIYFDS